MGPFMYKSKEKKDQNLLNIVRIISPSGISVGRKHLHEIRIQINSYRINLENHQCI